jgi:hypothetical protein
MSRPTLRLGSNGPSVIELQRLLNGKGANPRLATDGDFGQKTDRAVRAFQQANGLTVDGVVGPNTWNKLESGSSRPISTVVPAVTPSQGGTPPSRPPTTAVPAVGGSAGGGGTAAVPAITDPNYTPPRPGFGSPSHSWRVSTFGMFRYRWVGSGAFGRETIELLDNWRAENITTVTIPQLSGVQTYGGRFNGRVSFHKKATAQLQALFAAWEQAGLLSRILFWDGSYAPRYKRGQAGGGDSALSNHAWGTAFDINASQNPLGKVPAKIGQHGCVRELVVIAGQHGFYWGGFYNDGMHFEIGRLL